MAKNNFLLYKDFESTLDLLNDEQSGKLFKALYRYVNGRNEPNFESDGMLKVAFNILKTQLERDLLKYNERVKRNQENGKKGGRPSNKDDKTHSVNVEPKKPTRLIKNPTKAKKADSDSVSERDSVSDSLNDREKKDKTTKRFIKPTVEDINNYCKEKSISIDAESFIDFYESKGWKVGKSPMKDWKATVRNWARRNQKDTTPTESAKSKEIKKNLFGGRTF